MDINPIVLPSWLTEKSVFQQGVELVINGYAAPSATITLEIVKDPTDGRRVSKLDTEYGVILSLETTTSGKGRFEFKVPPYKASTDTYTFIFTCFSENVTIKDIARICKVGVSTGYPLWRRMGILRFGTSFCSDLQGQCSGSSYEEKCHEPYPFSDSSEKRSQ